MPTLHKYVDKDGFYVKHSFASKGRLFHTVYQVSDSAADAFGDRGLCDGSEVPRGLFRELRESGGLFTNKSGVVGESTDLDYKKESHNNPYEGLSPEARWWVMDMLTHHPHIKISRCCLETKEVEIENIPDRYLSQLFDIAHRYDGTSFFKNIALSYQKFIKHKPPREIQPTT